MSALTPLRGPPGHPLHAALSDLVVGMFVLATGLACVGYIGWVTEPAGKGAWLAAWRQSFGYLHGTVTTSGLALVCVGLATLLLGGFLGGSVVFVHGMRVLRLLPPQESKPEPPLRLQEATYGLPAAKLVAARDEGVRYR